MSACWKYYARLLGLLSHYALIYRPSGGTWADRRRILSAVRAEFCGNLLTFVRHIMHHPFAMQKLFIPLVLLSVLCGACVHPEKPVAPPAPVYPVPQPKQVAWQQLETYAFIHFGLNTFSDREWGYGDTDPQVFNPRRLDCDQWARTLRQAGMKGVILSAKHHDGFCLWPFEGTDYSVRRSPWRDGRGDVVGELAEACRRYGLKLGIYLSPWDRHRADYGLPSYVDYYHAQWKDLMTRYGPLFEIWLDGANGGDGWYGGACERRVIDRKTYYRLPQILSALDSLQPQAVVFSDGGPGCRWVGNERGEAGQTNWSFLRKGVVYPGYPHAEELAAGHADGDMWAAAECDVSIRPGWFYHPEEDGRVKSVEQLVDLYYKSVGRNATLLLNFPVDRDGLIHPTDSAHAIRFHWEIERQLAVDLLKGRTPSVSDVRGKPYGPEMLTDGQFDTYWATADSVTRATVEFRLPPITPVDCLMLQEYIPLGQRVQSFSVECLVDGQWQPVDTGGEAMTTIGYKRLLRFRRLLVSGIRIRFLQSRGPLCISNIALYDTQRVVWIKDARDERSNLIVEEPYAAR